MKQHRLSNQSYTALLARELKNKLVSLDVAQSLSCDTETCHAQQSYEAPLDQYTVSLAVSANEPREL